MKKTQVEIITIGDEILYGQITDTNSQWLSAELDKIGLRTFRKTSISDTEDDIYSMLKEASERSAIIITTGGLGPTNDDITKKVYARFFNTTMTIRPEVIENIDRLFRKRGREMSKLNEMQAEVPENGEVINNYIGTAPGMWFDFEGTLFIAMPGVPHEMKKMMHEDVFPRLQKRFKTPHIVHQMVKTIGIAESKLAALLTDWESSLPSNIKLAYLPRFGQVRLRLTATGTDLPLVLQAIEKEIEKLKPIIGKYVYAYSDEEIEKTIGQLLKAKNFTLAVAESCTGGLVSDQITNIPGCSAYFRGGIIAYHNDLKKELLGVSAQTLETVGAVSEETAIKMAEGIRKVAKSTIGISTTGIAGPDGGTAEKPVGTIWIGYADENESLAVQLNLTTDRQMNISFTHNALMTLLLKKLTGEEFVNAFARNKAN